MGGVEPDRIVVMFNFFRIHPSRMQVEIRDSSCHFPPFPQCIMAIVDTDLLSCTVNCHKYLACHVINKTHVR